MCGIAGFIGRNKIEVLISLLLQQQDRGRIYAGIALNSKKCFRGFGNIDKAFNKKGKYKIRGKKAFGKKDKSNDDKVNYQKQCQIAIGTINCRIDTTKIKKFNLQPLEFEFYFEKNNYALCFHGYLKNAKKLKKKLESTGSLFKTKEQAEIIFHLISKSKEKKLEHKIIEALRQLKGYYSLALSVNKKILFLARDPSGCKPLNFGKISNGQAFSTESTGLHSIEVKEIHEVSPGTLLKFEYGQPEFIPFPINKPKRKYCIYELLCLSGDECKVFEIEKAIFSQKIGEILTVKYLYKLFAKKNDIGICYVPNIGQTTADTIRNATTSTSISALVRNFDVGKNHITPTQYLSKYGPRIKLTVKRSLVKGKSLLVVDGPMVRGKTEKHIIKLLKEAGANKIYYFSKALVSKKCKVFTKSKKSRKHLLFNNIKSSPKSTEEDIAKEIGADFYGYLTSEELKVAYCCSEKNNIQADPNNLCTDCLN